MDFQAACKHEAGHGVAALVLGIPLFRAEVYSPPRSDGDLVRYGQCHVADADPRTLLPYIAAGEIAQRGRWRAANQTVALFTTTDAQDWDDCLSRAAADHFAALGVTPTRQQTASAIGSLAGEFWYQACDLVRGHLSSILTVAQALEERGSLTGAEVAALAGLALPGDRGASLLAAGKALALWEREAEGWAVGLGGQVSGSVRGALLEAAAEDAARLSQLPAAGRLAEVLERVGALTFADVTAVYGG